MKYIFVLIHLLLLGCQSSSNAQLPASFWVGTQYFQWQDVQRSDPYYGSKRLINVQVWYPTDASIDIQKFKKMPYYYKIEQASQQLDHWSKSDVKFAQQVQTHGLINAPFKKQRKKMPLIIFSPSLGGHTSLYTYYAEKLAQAGYIVAGVNHLYESEYVIDQNDQVYTTNHRFHDSLKTLKIPSQITADKYREVKGIRHKVLGQDLVFCLNQLKNSAFQQWIDFDKVGVWGHSIGGAAAIYASLLDTRFSAVLDLDGTPPTAAFKKGLQVPFMFIEDLIDYKNHKGYRKIHQRRQLFCNTVTKDAYRVMLAGTNHNSFLDIHYHSANSQVGKVKALKILQTTLNYMELFFDHSLKNKPMPLKATQNKQLEIFTFDK